MSKTYVANRKRNKTEWVSRPQAESQDAWGLTLGTTGVAQQSPAVLVDRKVNGGWEGCVRSNALTGYPTDHRQPIASSKRIDYTEINSTLWGIWVMPETPKGPKRPAKNTRAAQEAAKAISKAKVASKAAKASTPAKTGRPTKYNQETADFICMMLSEGMSLRQILKADTVGRLPAQSTVYEWLIRHTVFAEQYARAREEQADTNADEILSIADEMPPEYTDEKGRTSLDITYIQWQRQRIEARKWTAMKLKPKKYGDRVALEGVEGGAPIATQDATASKFEEIIRNMEMTKRAG